MAYDASELFASKDSHFDNDMKSDVSGATTAFFRAKCSLSRHRTTTSDNKMPTVSTIAAVFALLVSAMAAPGVPDAACPVLCYCDVDLSLVSCAGPEDDAAPSNNGLVTGGDKNGSAVTPDVWSTVARRGIQRLEVIDLAVESIRRETLDGTEHMTELSLVRCSLAAIGNGTFARHAALDRLDLSQNQLTVLSQGMLTGLIQLRSLDLSSNKLTKIDGALETLTALQQLNLRGNALLVLGPDAFKGLGRLQFLNVEGNSISAIHESAFQGLDELAHLVLSRNPLSGMQHVDLFAARLTYVDLSSARLNAVPSLITRYVRDLRLSGNNFTRLQRGDFDSVVQVRLLVLDECGISEIEEDALGRLDQLETLSLNGNRLVNVPASLPGASLTTIYLEANRIRMLRSGDFAGLQRLDQLHLARNAIESIESGAFHQLTSLARLDVRSNQLRYVKRDMFAGLVNLQFLDLSDNPLIISRAEVDRLRHLTNAIKIIITADLKTEGEPAVATATERFEGIVRAVASRPADEDRTRTRQYNNGANEATPVTSTAAKSEAAPPTPTVQALGFVGVLLSLSVLIVALFIGTGRWMRQSNWNRDNQSTTTTASWTRRAVGHVVDGSSALHPAKDIVRLGWVSGEDFDHWSTALLQNDTEHERLLLAVAPQH